MIVSWHWWLGVDGSLSCLDAVRVAVLQGAWTGTAVRLVHAFAWPPLGCSPPGWRPDRETVTLHADPGLTAVRVA